MMEKTEYTFEQFSKLFELSLSDAAKELGICSTALKKTCRKLGIRRWPYRTLKSINRVIEELEKCESSEKRDIELNYLKSKREMLLKNPSASTSPTSSPNMCEINEVNIDSCKVSVNEESITSLNLPIGKKPSFSIEPFFNLTYEKGQTSAISPHPSSVLSSASSVGIEAPRREDRAFQSTPFHYNNNVPLENPIPTQEQHSQLHHHLVHFNCNRDHPNYVEKKLELKYPTMNTVNYNMNSAKISTPSSFNHNNNNNFVNLNNQQTPTSSGSTIYAPSNSSKIPWCTEEHSNNYNSSVKLSPIDILPHLPPKSIPENTSCINTSSEPRVIENLPFSSGAAGIVLPPIAILSPSNNLKVKLEIMEPKILF